MNSPHEIKKKLELILPKQGKQVITPFVHGVPGIGKSAIVKQIAQERHIEFIDLRLSQHEASDIKGIPYPIPEDNICMWFPPEFLPFKTTRKYKDTAGILFLDEINRAAPDVLQTVFQLVLDRQVGNLELCDEWHIVCAGNLGAEDGCDVVDFDPSLNNRFIHFYMEPHLDSWCKWAEKNNINDDIVAFLKGKPAYLYHSQKDKKTDETFLTTPRSWEKFSDLIEQNDKMGIKNVTNMLAANMIGDAAVHFMKYLEEKTLVEPKDVLNKYKDTKHKIDAMSREQKYATNQELVVYISQMKRVEKKHLENIHKYMVDQLEDDIHIAFLKEIAKKTDGENKNNFIDKYLDAYEDESDKVIEICTKSPTEETK